MNQNEILFHASEREARVPSTHLLEDHHVLEVLAVLRPGWQLRVILEDAHEQQEVLVREEHLQQRDMVHEHCRSGGIKSPI